MKQIKFTKEVVINRHYEVSLEDFLSSHFREAQRWQSELDIYVRSGTNNNYITKVFSVTLLPEELNLDFNDVDNVKLVLKRHLKEE